MKPNKTYNSKKKYIQSLHSQIQELFEKEGEETFEEVKKVILEEKIESQNVKEALNHFLSYGKKGFLVRPTLISLGTKTVGGTINSISKIAKPLVLISAGMDIHDDIIDNQKRQNRKLTVFGKFNKDIALLVGDALIFKGLILWCQIFNKFPMQKFVKMTSLLKRAFFEVGDGQAQEVSLKRKVNVDPKYYMHIVSKKAADIEALLHLGALISNASKDEIKALRNYGRCLGMLWILGDDVVDIFDHNELRRRIKHGCLPLPLFYAMENPRSKIQLRKILLKTRITQKDTETILEITIKSAGLEKTKKVMEKLMSEALKCIERFENVEHLKLLIRDYQNFIEQI